MREREKAASVTETQVFLVWVWSVCGRCATCCGQECKMPQECGMLHSCRCIPLPALNTCACRGAPPAPWTQLTSSHFLDSSFSVLVCRNQWQTASINSLVDQQQKSSQLVAELRQFIVTQVPLSPSKPQCLRAKACIWTYLP